LDNAIHVLEQWSASVGLVMNYAKTEMMVFHKANDSSAIPDQHISTSNGFIKQVPCFKYLGIWLDPTLSFKNHFKKVESKVAFSIGRVDRLKRKINNQTFNLLLNCYVLSNIDYCLSVWAVHAESEYEGLQRRIDNLINSYYRPLTAKRKFKQQRTCINSKYKEILKSFSKDTTDLWEICNMHSVIERINYYILLETHKTLYAKSSPAMMKDWFKIHETVRQTRNSRKLQVPVHKSQTFKKSFKYRAIELWNNAVSDGDVVCDEYIPFKSNVSKFVMKHRKVEFVYFK